MGNFYTNDSWYYSDLELGEKYYADYGDLLYTWSATFGPHIWLGDRVIYHYHIWKINLSDQLEKQFAVQLLEQDRANILSSKNGSTMVHITKEGMEQKDVIIPPSTKEQQEIGAFFLQLDNLITLHQRQPFLHSPPDISLIVQLTPPFYTFSWEQRKLGELVDVCSGRDYKHLSEGTIPVYGTGGYMLSVNDALSYDRDAIGIGRKGTIDRPYILKAPFWTVDTLFYAIPREKADLNFAFDIFQNIDWKKKDESTGVPSLSKTAINDIDVLAPKHGEQQTIGQFFAAIDHLITLHQRQTIVYAVIRSIRKVILAERQYLAPPMVRKSP